MLPYSRQNITEDDIQAVVEVLKSDYLTTGSKVSEFEEKLCELTGAKYAVVCSSGTSALHLACLALGIGKEDLGLTSAITFLASANGIEYCGGKADFVDIDSESLCISTGALEDYCKSLSVPKVVIPVDYAGIPADLPKIWDLAKTYGFKVIEDAAHSIGSTYNCNGNEYQCGGCSHSDLAVFSFHPVKTITTGEGGAVLTNNSVLADKLRLFRSHGMTKDQKILSRSVGPWYYEMVNLGYNYRITDIQCALGVSQLKRLNKIKTRRQEIVKAYNNEFSKTEQLILPPWPENTSPCFHLYPIQFVDGSVKRKNVYQQLLEKNITTQVHYLPIYRQPYYEEKYGKKHGKYQNAEKYYSSCLSLPLFPTLKNSEIDCIAETVKGCL